MKTQILTAVVKNNIVDISQNSASAFSMNTNRETMKTMATDAEGADTEAFLPVVAFKESKHA